MSSVNIIVSCDCDSDAQITDGVTPLQVCPNCERHYTCNLQNGAGQEKVMPVPLPETIRTGMEQGKLNACKHYREAFLSKSFGLLHIKKLLEWWFHVYGLEFGSRTMNAQPTHEPATVAPHSQTPLVTLTAANKTVNAIVNAALGIGKANRHIKKAMEILNGVEKDTKSQDIYVSSDQVMLDLSSAARNLYNTERDFRNMAIDNMDVVVARSIAELYLQKLLYGR